MEDRGGRREERGRGRGWGRHRTSPNTSIHSRNVFWRFVVEFSSVGMDCVPHLAYSLKVMLGLVSRLGERWLC